MSTKLHSAARPATADARGCPIAGATELALQAYEAALAAFQNWRQGAEPLLDAALREAPQFVMAQVLRAYLLLCSRDPRRVRAAVPVVAGLRGLPANAWERGHIAALHALLADDIELAKSRLGEQLRQQPLDVLALQVAHAFDYLSGDLPQLQQRVAAVLPAWSPRLLGYGTVLAMHAFGLEESGDYAPRDAGGTGRAADQPAGRARAPRDGPCARDERAPRDRVAVDARARGRLGAGHARWPRTATGTWRCTTWRWAGRRALAAHDQRHAAATARAKCPT